MLHRFILASSNEVCTHIFEVRVIPWRRPDDSPYQLYTSDLSDFDGVISELSFVTSFIFIYCSLVVHYLMTVESVVAIHIRAFTHTFPIHVR